MQRLDTLRKVPSLTHDLRIGLEAEATLNLATTADWRRSTLASVPLDEEMEEDDEQLSVASGSKGDVLPRRNSPLSPARRRSDLKIRSPLRSAKALVSAAPLLRLRSPHRPTKRHQALEEDDGLPSLAAKWARVQATCLRGEGFQQEDIEAMRVAFSRFQAPHERDVDRTDLDELVQYLGYVMTSKEDLERLANEVTPYSCMAFDEFLEFMEKYSSFETQRFQNFFKEFDKDDSGELSVKELRELMVAIGFIPFKPMIEEALEIVDADGNGQLAFEEFVFFLTVYRHAQGFTRRQVRQMRNVFNRFSKDGKGLTHVAITPALCMVFGRQVEKNADILKMRLLGQGWLARCLSSKQGSWIGNEEDDEDCLHFPEFLIFARRLKELESADYTAQFHQHDKDQSGTISLPEIMSMLKGMGHEPLRAPVQEVLKEVAFASDEDDELDLGEFFNFLELFWEREGFLRAELEEIHQAFKSFADDKSIICTKEVSAVFQTLGYRVPAVELAQLVTEHDVNHSGSLDLFEVTRLMRTYRDSEIRRLREIFRQFRGRGEKVIDGDSVSDALSLALGENMSSALQDITQMHKKKRGVTKQQGAGAFLALRACAMVLRSNSNIGIDFDTFVELTDLGRARRMERERCNAGFKEEELNEFKCYFNSLDLNQSGLIKVEPKLLSDLAIDWNTKADQAAALALLEEATAAARATNADVMREEGQFAVGFSEFLQMLRLILDKREKVAEEAIEATADKLSFSWSEVEQFRDIFNSWAAKESSASGDESVANLHKVTIRSIGRMHNRPGISPSTMASVVRSLGVYLSQQQRQALIEHAARQDMNLRGQLTFPGFLQMVRWLLDSDFGGINAAAAKAAGTMAEKYLGRIRRDSLVSAA